MSQPAAAAGRDASGRGSAACDRAAAAHRRRRLPARPEPVPPAPPEATTPPAPAKPAADDTGAGRLPRRLLPLPRRRRRRAHASTSTAVPNQTRSPGPWRQRCLPSSAASSTRRWPVCRARSASGPPARAHRRRDCSSRRSTIARDAPTRRWRRMQTCVRRIRRTRCRPTRLLRMADLVQQTKRPDRMKLARSYLDQIVANFPTTSVAPRALAQRATIEEREDAEGHRPGPAARRAGRAGVVSPADGGVSADCRRPRPPSFSWRGSTTI